MQTVDPEALRHRALAGISRTRLLAVLHQSATPLGVRELAHAVGLHPNTAREHLDRLVGAGLASRETAAPSGRGRPRLRYAADQSTTEGDQPAYRALATVLANQLARRPDGDETARDAGEAWGAAAVAQLSARAPGRDAFDRLVEILDDAGFAPERSESADGTLRLRSCPFGALASQDSIVCNVHLGLMRGALRQLGAPPEPITLEPFVEPGLCLARVGSVVP